MSADAGAAVAQHATDALYGAATQAELESSAVAASHEREEGEEEQFEDDDEYEDDSDDDDGAITLYSDFIDVPGTHVEGTGARMNSGGVGMGAGRSAAAASGAAASAAPARVQVGEYRSSSVGAGVSASVRESERRLDAARVRQKDKADRATAEQVLDPRTRALLQKLVSGGVVSAIHGCVSTGKEANVYYAQGVPGTEFEGDAAVKVYKTSILVFKDRDRYVTGEYRFRHGYAKSNPRKMVRVWAEKEMRNLKRLWSAGIPCPRPLALKSHVLAMTFLGEEGRAAPRLKNAELSPSQLRAAYAQVVRLMRRMYAECRLIHADLSEYNLLYYHDLVHVIDVSQSVEHDHPAAMEFLKKDVDNMTRFFGSEHSGAVAVMSRQQLFEYVTAEGVVDEEAHLSAAQARAAREPLDPAKDSLWMDLPVVRRLNELADHEREHEKIVRGEEGALDAIAMLTVQKPSAENEEAERKEKKSKGAKKASKESKDDEAPALVDDAPSSKSLPAASTKSLPPASISLPPGASLPPSMMPKSVSLPPGAAKSLPTKSVSFASSLPSTVSLPPGASFPSSVSLPPGASGPPRSSAPRSSKPSAKAVVAPTQVATARDASTSQLFAGLLLPQANDQDESVITNQLERGYDSKDEEDDDEEEDDEEEEDDAEEDLRPNLNHTEAGGRRLMKHLRRGAEDDSESEDDDEEQDEEESGSGSESEESEEEERVWVERPSLDPAAARAARKAATKEAKALQAEKRKSKIPKKVKKKAMKNPHKK